MNRYEIRCTEEQTRKALELGAPIKAETFTRPGDGKKVVEIGEYNLYSIPTAEQMLGWLEEHGIVVEIVKCEIYWLGRAYSSEDAFFNKGCFISRIEATIAAIDKALEYLSEKEK